MVSQLNRHVGGPPGPFGRASVRWRPRLIGSTVQVGVPPGLCEEFSNHDSILSRLIQHGLIDHRWRHLAPDTTEDNVDRIKCNEDRREDNETIVVRNFVPGDHPAALVGRRASADGGQAQPPDPPRRDAGDQLRLADQSVSQWGKIILNFQKILTDRSCKWGC